MRLPRPHLPARTTIALVATPLVALALAAGATGLVAVYSNNFSSKGQYKEIKRSGGGDRGCGRSYRSGAKVMRVIVSGKRLCSYSPPVQGDGPRPDHDFAVDGRVLKGTPRQVRKAAYLAISVRVGRGDSYELQIRPKAKRFKLARNPDGAAFPVNGESNAINGIGERNKLRIRAKGPKIVGYVNGRRLAQVTDPDAADLDGAKLAFGLGSRRSAPKGPLGTFDRVRVRVPSP